MINKKVRNSEDHSNYIRHRDYYIGYSRKNWKAYYEKNKVKILKRARGYYKKNRLGILGRVKRYYLENKDLKKEYNKSYRLANLERLKEYDKNNYFNNLDRIREYRRKNAFRIAESRKNYRAITKQNTLAYYSNNAIPKCKGCGETDISLLTIDHINGDGAKERRRLGRKGGIEFYIWLRKSNYPSGYQVLCYNCNWLKRYENKETVRSKYSKKIKIELLSHYVSTNKKIECSLCGVNKLEVLTIDHIYGGGHIEQQRLGLKGTEYYRYLARKNYPPGFRILCMNCNVSAARPTFSTIKIGA